MANNNDGVVESTSYSMSDLGNLPDDELRETTILTVYNNDPIPENQSLSQRIGVCTNMTQLRVMDCASFPPAIFTCTLLSTLYLFSNGNDNDDCRIELPVGSILSNLTTVCIAGGGNWNTNEIILWLASSCPNLRNLYFSDLSRDTVNQLMRELQNNEPFTEKFKHTLKLIAFYNCNLNEDDARVIIVNMTQLYPNLSSIGLSNNNIEGLDTVAMAVRETPSANNNLRHLNLDSNPFSPNLNDPNSSDHDAMMSLLKEHEELGLIQGFGETTMTYSSKIAYSLLMNASELRYMSDDGHGDTKLNILPYVMKHVYLKTGEDPTSVFTLLREGPICRRYKFEKTPLLFVDDKKDDSDDKDVDDDDIDDDDDDDDSTSSDQDKHEDTTTPTSSGGNGTAAVTSSSSKVAFNGRSEGGIGEDGLRVALVVIVLAVVAVVVQQRHYNHYYNKILRSRHVVTNFLLLLLLLLLLILLLL